MRQESIEEKKARRKWEAVRGVLLFGLMQAACIVCFAALCLIPDIPGWMFALFAVLTVICVVPLVTSVVILRQRFKEIEGGELDEAGQY